MHKEIAFSGDLSEEQKAVLLRVANCSAEKMLAGGMKFINTLVEAARGDPSDRDQT